VVDPIELQVWAKVGVEIRATRAPRIRNRITPSI